MTKIAEVGRDHLEIHQGWGRRIFVPDPRPSRLRDDRPLHGEIGRREMKRRKPKAKEKMMKNIVRATAAAMFAVALMIPVAFAQTSAISGEVKKIDEGA